MSCNITDCRTGQDVYVNDSCGKIIIGDNTFTYNELLPVIQHYICGGIMGHSQLLTPPDALEAIRFFIKNVKNLVECEIDCIKFLPTPDNKPNIKFILQYELDQYKGVLHEKV
jgi:hypothetical protein